MKQFWVRNDLVLKNVMNVKQLNLLKTDLTKGQSGQSDTESNSDLKEEEFFCQVVDPVIIPWGEGLVGTVASSGNLVNIINAEHVSFHFSFFLCSVFVCQQHQRRTCKFSLFVLFLFGFC